MKLPLTLPASAPIAEIQQKLDALEKAAQYGWGHTIDFGPFTKQGFLGTAYLDIAQHLDDWGWWPKQLQGMDVADVGCFTGGLSLLMAARGAATVHAVDEVPAHLAQCSYLAELFTLPSIAPMQSAAYLLPQQLAPRSLDLILLSGVLYHMSDMLVGLYAMNQLLKPGGVLLIETNGVNDFKRSYANFGRFYAGMWWQPSGLCIKDMCEFMGFGDVDVRFYKDGRCLARAIKTTDDIVFKRGMHWPFTSLGDGERRTMDKRLMAPAREPITTQIKYHARSTVRKIIHTARRVFSGG